MMAMVIGFMDGLPLWIDYPILRASSNGMLLFQLRLSLFIVWLNYRFRYRVPPPHFHSTFSTVKSGDARQATCLRCGFTAAGTNLRLLERVVQDHKCAAERRGPENDVPDVSPRKAAS